MNTTVLTAAQQRLHWRAADTASQEWIGLAQEAGAAEKFWGQYLQRMGGLVRARRVLLLGGAVGQPWQALAQWPAKARVNEGDAQAVEQAVESLLTDKPQLAMTSEQGCVMSMRLPQAPAAADQVLALVLLCDQPMTDEAQGWLSCASLAAALPAWWARQSLLLASARDQAAAQAQPTQAEPLAVARAQRLHGLLLLAARLWGHDRFLRQAFELCGDLAQQHSCDRVSLGWRDGPYIRLQAISQIEKFDAKSSAVRALESAMEEAADQVGDLVYPLPEGIRQVERAHGNYARIQGTEHLLSVPLRQGEQVCGVITLERNSQAFTDDERWELGQLSQLVAHPMARLHERDRWWGEFAWRAAQRKASELLGPRHSAWKLGLMGGLLLLLITVFTPWNYRVEAPLNLRSKDVLFMPAPFDGYLKEVHVEVGERVRAGQVLASLDTRDLALESSMAMADFMRFGREAEKAQAARQLADMQITLARQQQAAARLALVEHQLHQARVVAPNDGIVVEGDLKKNLGSPLRKGDLLLKLAQTEEIVVEIAIDEADVHEVRVGSRGEFALVGRPDQRFGMSLKRIDPASTLKDGRNVYLARAEFDGAVPNWWRPGMGGTVRIDAGERSLLWVMTHRTVRFLRKVFWL